MIKKGKKKIVDMKMDNDETEDSTIGDILYSEGFDYAFVNYSDFEFVKDSKFHTLRKKYLAAREVLRKYIGAPEYV